MFEQFNLLSDTLDLILKTQRQKVLGAKNTTNGFQVNSHDLRTVHSYDGRDRE